MSTTTEQQRPQDAPPIGANGNGQHATATATEAPAPAAQPTPTGEPATRGRKRLVLLGVLVLAVVVGVFVGGPKFFYALHHISTDDATVNSHVTYLSARIAGETQEVLVDDNQYVAAGTPLVRIDAAPYRIAVEQKRASLDKAKQQVDQDVAALDVAKADLAQARDQAKASLAGLKASWFLVATVQDLVRWQTASVQSAAANLRQQQAMLKFTHQEFDRVQKDQGGNLISQEEIDRRRTAVEVAQAQVAAAEQGVRQARAMLGLPADATNPEEIPTDVAQTFSGTQYAVASAEQSLAALGVPVDIVETKLVQLRDKLLSLSAGEVIERAPAVRAAAARVRQAQAALGGDTFDPVKRYEQPAVVEAQKELEDAQLQLGYTDLRAPIAGFVSRRTVNVGTHVTAGQPLMALRPLQDVWVDANFKETQLKDLRIGQAVELYVDAYPTKTFKGRVAGFSPGTGAVLSLLPPENATGNFVKVVQRLPVRIELTEAISRETPLFAGLSVMPEVDTRTAPTGPDAGERLLSARPIAPAGLTGAVATAVTPVSEGTPEDPDRRAKNPGLRSTSDPASAVVGAPSSSAHVLVESR